MAPSRLREITKGEWIDVFEKLRTSTNMAAWESLRRQGHELSFGSFKVRLRIEKERRRLAAEDEQRRLDAEAATHAPPAVAMLHAVPLGASIVAEGVPVPGALKRTHEAALGSSDAPGWRAQVARMRGATPQQHKFKVDARMMSH